VEVVEEEDEEKKLKEIEENQGKLKIWEEIEV
jgi:hypothetical protein